MAKESTTVSKDKPVNKIPEINGANLKTPIKDKSELSITNLTCEITLDNSELEVLELLERNEGITFFFAADSFLELSDETLDKLNMQSKRNYFLEENAYKAFKRREEQELDDERLSNEMEAFAEPTFSRKFKPTKDELKKYPEDKFVHVWKRPDEINECEEAGYVNIGEREGTPVAKKGDRAYQNMVHMVLPKAKHDRLLKFYSDKSRKRTGLDRANKNEFIEVFEGGSKMETSITNTKEALNK